MRGEKILTYWLSVSPSQLMLFQRVQSMSFISMIPVTWYGANSQHRCVKMLIPKKPTALGSKRN